MMFRRIALLVLRVLLGLFFLADGVIKLSGMLRTPGLFERIGWGQWFRYFTGGLVLLGGAAILLRLRWTSAGAIACACSVGAGALLYAFKLHQDATLPTLLTLLALALAVLAYSEQKRRQMQATGLASPSAGGPAT